VALDFLSGRRGTLAALEFWAGIGGYIDLEQVTPWNTLLLDGVTFPSAEAPMFITSMSGEVGFDVDRRQRKNRSGRKKTSTGSKSPQWTMGFQIITSEQYQAWKALLPQINPKLDANRAKVRRVFHPFLADYEITQAFIHRLPFPQWDAQLLAAVTLHFEDVGSSDSDTKKALKPTTDPNSNAAALDDRFKSDNPQETAPPTILQSRGP
jgi:hypothetical protein